MLTLDKPTQEALAKAIGLTVITGDQRVAVTQLLALQNLASLSDNAVAAIRDLAAATREHTVAYEASTKAIEGLIAAATGTDPHPPADPLP